jgi:hypothetical protein
MADSPQLQAALDSLAAFGRNLPPETQGDFNDLLADLEVGVKAEVDQAIAANAPKIPVVGPIAAKIMQDAANKALDDALAELTAAKQGA